MRVTIACPEAMIADANQLMRCVGQSAADDDTFAPASWVDGAGNRYSAASMLVPSDWQTTVMGTLSAPEWGADMTAAGRARVDMLFAVAADPSRIAVIVGDDPQAAIAALGIAVAEAG